MIKLAKSSFYNESLTKRKLARFITSAAQLSMGVQTRNFEKAFSRRQKRRFAVFVNSGSSANLALLQSLQNIGYLKRGSRVGVSAVTWSTNIMPVIELGMVPVVIDCALDTLNISPKTLSLRLKDIDCLFLTHVLGFSDDIRKITAMCKDAGVLLIEDNCESLGSKTAGKPLGNFGLASTFSFFVGHHLSTIEGGMIATDDTKLAYALLMVRAHGWDRQLPVKERKRLRRKFHVDDFFASFTFYDLAFNIRPTDMQGFLGNEQLRYLPFMIKARERNFFNLLPHIAANPEFIPLRVNHMDIVSNFAVPIVTKTKQAYEKYRSRFKQRGVEIRPVIAGDITKQPFFRKYISRQAFCPNANHIHHHGFYFANNAEITQSELSLLVSLLKP